MKKKTKLGAFSHIENQKQKPKKKKKKKPFSSIIEEYMGGLFLEGKE